MSADEKHRDAVTGEYVTARYAAEHPDTTVAETDALDHLEVHPDVDPSTAEQVAFKRLDGTPVTVGQVAEAQARLLDLVARRARNWQKSGNPGRRAAGAELLELLGR